MFRKSGTHHTFDLDEKPLLYEYYTNTLNPIIDRRGFDEVDNRLGKRSIDIDSDRYGKRFFLERSRILPTVQDQQQRQQVIILVLYKLSKCKAGFVSLASNTDKLFQFITNIM